MSTNQEILVEVNGVSKKFSKNLKRSLFYGLQSIFKIIFGLKSRNEVTLKKDEFWAVKDVSFQLKRGECLGLIGHNGAGKSTLLKMLNGLIKPDEGEIIIKGKVGALIELGAGFNPVLTGRENIYINGQILGFTKKEIDERFNDIVAFSEIGSFIDTPVQNYSSGMKVKLGFAVAAQMEPDVLIIDEVLAVGDLGFRIKCLNRISQLLKNTCVIFVSHAMPQVSRVSNVGLMLNHGRIEIFSNDIGQVIHRYYNFFEAESKSSFILGESSIISVECFDINNRLSDSFYNGDLMKIQVVLKVDEKIDKFSFRIFFVNQEMRNVLDVPSDLIFTSLENTKSKMLITTEISNLPLNTGNYGISLVMVNNDTGERVMRIDNFKRINVKTEKYISWTDGLLKAKWEIN